MVVTTAAVDVAGNVDSQDARRVVSLEGTRCRHRIGAGDYRR